MRVWLHKKPKTCYTWPRKHFLQWTWAFISFIFFVETWGKAMHWASIRINLMAYSTGQAVFKSFYHYSFYIFYMFKNDWKTDFGCDPNDVGAHQGLKSFFLHFFKNNGIDLLALTFSPRHFSQHRKRSSLRSFRFSINLLMFIFNSEGVKMHFEQAGK